MANSSVHLGNVANAEVLVKAECSSTRVLAQLDVADIAQRRTPGQAMPQTEARQSMSANAF